jgi:DNA-binding NarL/FixJ family response regulator
VLIADDHVPVRAGVRLALERGGCEVCADAANADDAIAAAVRERPDVCLVDLGMPGNGMRAVAEIAAQVAGTRVVVLTVSNSKDDLLDALRAGAVGYLLKDMDPSRLPVVVRAVAAGETAIPRALSAVLVDELRRRPTQPLLAADGVAMRLTAREWEILELLADGQSTSEISARLFVDQVTVRRHVSATMRKLGVTTRAEAIQLLDEHRAT